MKSVLALGNVVVKELYRRKDFYVLFVMTVIITLLMAVVNFFNDPNIVRFMKEGCLMLIWVSALIIAITTTARQIPAERESRTIFPLLAKPVTRAQVIAGKFMGCWLAAGIALLVFYFFFGVISGAREHHWPLVNWVQALWLQWFMLAIVIALTLLGSLVFSAASANATICFFVVLGLMLLGGHLNQVATQQPEPVRTLVETIYFLIPHLEWFDIRDLVIYDQPPVDWLACVLATLYAAIYTVFFLSAAWLVFRRKALTT